METILKVRHLKKCFEDKVVLQDVSFDLRKGETVALLGHSGTGKSVLLRSLIGLEDIDDGEIVFKDVRIDNMKEKQLFLIRTRISYSFQSGALFDSLSVFENIAYPLFEHTKLSEAEVERKVEEILELVNLKDSKDLLPADLSGGMQKRVGLARSMALDPDILLYDESTAGLDPVNVELVLEVMRRFKESGISGIFVTHDIPAALRISDRILILKEGRIAYDGPPTDFAASEDPFVKTFSTALGGSLENQKE